MTIPAGVRWIIFCLFVSSMGLSVIGFGLDSVYYREYQPKILKWKSQKSQSLTSFLTEKEFFRRHPFFGKVSQRQSNLLQLVKSLGGGTLSSSADDKQELLSLKEDWLDRRFKVPKKETSAFFARISSYDYYSAPGQTDENQVLKPYDFIALSQIHLAQNVDEPPPTQRLVLNSTHHLAWILVQSTNFNFQLAALSILEKEREFSLFQSRRSPSSQALWPFTSTQDIQRFRRYLYETYDFFDLLLGTKTLESLFLKSPWTNEFCSIYRLKMPHLLEASTYLEGGLLGEPLFWQDIESLKAMNARGHAQCPSVATPPKIDRTLLSRIPFLRRFIGLRLLLSHKSMAKGL